MYVYESDNLNVRANVNLTVCVSDLEQSYVRVSNKVVRVKSECLSVNVRARVNILSVSVFFLFSFFVIRTGTSSARRKSARAPTTVTSCCNRTRAPPSAAKSAKVRNRHRSFFLSFFLYFAAAAV